MCGIAGYSGSFSPDLLTAMSSVMIHRGPDDEGSWADPSSSVGLAHRRLSIIDTSSSGHQPMWDATGQVAIVFNGEIYGYRRLRQELEADGFKFRSGADTEVLLNLWLQRGREALHKIDGMYAFALWDTRTSKLTLARDPAGIKPLYFSQTRAGVVFASEMKSLLQSSNVDRALDPIAVLQTLTYLWSPGPRTVLAAVEKLQPGGWLELQEGAISAAGRIQPKRPARNGVSDAPLAIRNALSHAVHDQSVADVPVGAFLSGGVDSTAIVALARRENPSIECFTIGTSRNSDGFESDLPYAKLAANKLGVKLHIADVSTDLTDHLDFMLYHLDEPQADLAPLQVYLIAETARSLGVKVLLSGAGGDDLFGGYRRHAAVSLERHWQWLPVSARTVIGSSAGRAPVGRPWGRRVQRAFSNAALDQDVRAVSYLHWISNSDAMNLLSSGFKDQLNERLIDSGTLGVFREQPPTSTNLSRLLAVDERYFLVDHNLNYTDKMSMATGVEVRVPFLDDRVVDVAHRLSDRQLVRNGQTKVALREAFKGIVPKEILERPKVGFGVPLREWLTGPLEPWIQEQLAPTTLERRGIFNPQAVDNLLSANRRGTVDASYPLLSIALIERWMQLFVDEVPGSHGTPVAPHQVPNTFGPHCS